LPIVLFLGHRQHQTLRKFTGQQAFLAVSKKGMGLKRKFAQSTATQPIGIGGSLEQQRQCVSLFVQQQLRGRGWLLLVLLLLVLPVLRSRHTVGHNETSFFVRVRDDHHVQRCVLHRLWLRTGTAAAAAAAAAAVVVPAASHDATPRQFSKTPAMQNQRKR